MKKAGLCLALLLAVTGCGRQGTEMEQGTALRSRFLSRSCTFETQITADYGETVNVFDLSCTADPQGNLTFKVLEPEEIADISGKISENEGNLIFDGQALAFPLLADDQLSPAAAPWVVVHTLQSGLLRTCTQHNSGLRLDLDDRYEEKAMAVTVWTDQAELPVRAEILWEGRRILFLEIRNFKFM